MIIKNARLKDGMFDLRAENGIITEIGKLSERADIDACGRMTVAGLIDTHIHGYGGYDVMDGRLSDISRELSREGTTSFLATTMTDSIERLEEVSSVSLECDGAVPLGFHLEGPFISKERKGAQNERYIIDPDYRKLSHIANVKKITIAPECEGACELIQTLGCKVSIGHTDCTYEDALLAIDAGADCLTHAFNAMPPMLHRAPGPIGAAVERGIFAEVICDGVHVSGAALKLLYRALGAERVMLVSDALACAGMPDGEYRSGGLAVKMQNGVAILSDGTLAGGSHSLLYCVRKATEFGIDVWEAVRMASETPAAYLGLNKGRIALGYDADILILNEDMSVYASIVGGKRVC